jgi:protein-S-isoprenylcysteine O-methyltransferase Ste14
MGIGASVFLIAIGALLAFAVRDTTLGGWLDLNTAGWVLIVVGAIGLIVALIIWGSHRRSTVVEQPTRRRVVDDDTY